MVKRLLYCATALAVLALAGVSCDQSDISTTAEFDVFLDPDNQYFAGEPIQFNFSGNAENITFYSGETGHQYKYANRYEVPAEDVNSAKLVLTALVQYGHADDTLSALDIMISHTYPGLDGNDVTKDSLALRKMEADTLADGTFKDWKIIEQIPGSLYSSSRATMFAEREYEIPAEYLDGFSIAFHYHPNWMTTTMGISSWKKMVYMSGSINVDIDGALPSKQAIIGLSLKGIQLQESTQPIIVANRYATVNWNTTFGGIVMGYPSKDCVSFCGGKHGNGNDYIDAWVISDPLALNVIDPDTGVVVKGLTEFLPHYSYKFEEPGTYEVIFRASNASHLGLSTTEKKMTITILDKME